MHLAEELAKLESVQFSDTPSYTLKGCDNSLICVSTVLIKLGSSIVNSKNGFQQIFTQNMHLVQRYFNHSWEAHRF